jgi:hypothetical protein
MISRSSCRAELHDKRGTCIVKFQVLILVSIKDCGFLEHAAVCSGIWLQFTNTLEEDATALFTFLRLTLKVKTCSWEGLEIVY